jgi:hypothetical protein
MARPSPAALDVMEHIADAIDALDALLAALDHLQSQDVEVQVSYAREEMRKARSVGAEVLLELLNLSERQELMQSEMQAIRERTH